MMHTYIQFRAQQKYSSIHNYKDGCTGKTGGFCKHKSRSLYNQAVEVICQEVAMALSEVGT